MGMVGLGTDLEWGKSHGDGDKIFYRTILYSE
jgi:hypothetical protein